jgi:NodT family efflux transporter outer membrane factor (OMF) lipoprotein
MLRPERPLDLAGPASRRARRGALLASLALWLSSCKVGPDAPPQTPAPKPTAIDAAPLGESVSTAQQPLPRWWTSLKDPLLDDLVARADEANQTLAAAVANARAAYAAVGASEAQLWPTIGAGAQYNRVLSNAAQLAALNVRPDPYETYAYGVGMSSWELDVWGGVRREVEAAQASAESRVDQLRDALVSVRSQVAASYVQLRMLQAQRAALVSNRDALATTLELSRERLAAGTTNALEVSRAQAEFDSADAQLPQLDAGIASTVSTIAVLCGGSPSEFAPVLAEQQPVPVAPDVAGIGLPEELLTRRPDVRAAQQRLLAATAAIGAAESYRFPKLTLSGNFYIAATGTDGLSDLSNKAYAFGPSLSLPLFTGGKIDAAVNQKRAEAEAALAQYRGAILTAVGDVSACASDFSLARETRRRSDLALASAEAALGMAQQQYDAGLVDYGTLLDVQRAKLSAESAAVEARAAVTQGYVALQRALGAGWDVEEQAVAAAQSAASNQEGNAR